MLLSSILLTAFMAVASPITRYECNSNNIFSIVTKVALSKQEAVLVVRDNIDLAGKKLNLSNTIDVVIEGGSLRNGAITGDRTAISAGAYPVFDESVSLGGTWVVDNAYAEWFGMPGTSDDTEKIQKCLDVFCQCNLLNRSYMITTLNLPDNASLEGSGQMRYRMSTLQQKEDYKGDAIITGDKAYSGVRISNVRITGGRETNTAIRISVPNSRIEDVFCDEYRGDGINLNERAWGTKLKNCSVYGNIADAKKRTKIGTGILVNTKGGLVDIDGCDIVYYQTGIHIKQGVRISVRGCNISECSQNHFKHPDACIKISGGESIDICDNYIENFNTGILLLGGKSVDVHNNYINGLSVALFGVDVKGAVENVDVRNNHIYMGYKGAWAVSLRTTKAKADGIRLLNNDLDKKKLYKIDNQK